MYLKQSNHAVVATTFHYSFQIIKKRMIVGQLPSLQEIYDYSSEDLRKIVSSLNEKVSLEANDSEKNAQLMEYIENINIELEQRKTLEFFQELCAHDNPYVKKVTDFNNQFLKLAEEAIAQQEGRDICQNASIPDNPHRTAALQSNEAHDARSVTSAISSETQFSYQQQQYDKSTTSSEKRFGNAEKKMGIGITKTRAKNSMKDFILSTLTKNKADCTYVVKKGGPPKPQPAFTVNQRGHLVSPSTLEPISTKSIKSNSSVKPQTTPLSSTKQTNKDSKRPNEDELQKKRKEVVEKMKGRQPEKKKEKHLNNKDLVEMIREQERQKQKRLNQQYETATTSGSQKRSIDTETVKQEMNSKGQSNFDDSEKEEIKQQIVVQQRVREQPKMQKNEEINEQIVDEEHHILQDPVMEPKNQKSPITLETKQIDKKQEISNQNQLNPFQPKSSHHSSLEVIEKSYKPEAVVEVQKVEDKQDPYAYQRQKEELKEIKRQAELEEQAYANMAFKKKQEPFGVIVNLNTNSSPTTEADSIGVAQLNSRDHEKLLKKDSENKKCYNEDYWIHIREQAEFQIKRFKEQKELQENHKVKITNQIKQAITSTLQRSHSRPNEDESQMLQADAVLKKEPIKDEADEFYEKKKKQLTKMVNEHKKRVAPKRISAAAVAPPKPLYALPTFNYLEVYPTFNHIFSVMYTKAQHQAIQDIPSIMKQLTNIFSTHLNHFKSKNTYFQAAIFLPFDSASKTQMTDPKQLLLHTETTYVNLKKMVERLEIFNSNLHGQICEGENRYYRVVKTKQEVYDIITTGFLRRKLWKELPHGCSLRSSWNLFWSWSKPDIDISKLLVWQRINHFPFNKNLSRKDLLYKNLDAFRKMLKIPFNFLPLTFNLPKEYTQFSIKFHEEEMLNRDMNYWIMKPIGKSRGRGIKVISNLAELNYTDNIVVQKYITNPLLLEGYKFDMRIYVLVTSFHPLEAFVYREGFARLSTERFSLEPMMMKNAYIHLTNFAVNKNNEDAKQSAHFSGGSKISLKTLKDKLTKMDYSFPKIWSQVHEIIIKSLLGCSVSVPPFPAAFELFGYDIMIDTDGACHLIEINASPSLERSYLIDEIIKQSLIDDILDIVDPPEFDKEQLLDIMSDRLAGKGKISPEQDLIAIARCLKYKKIRKVGQMPENMGLFERVAPSEASRDLERLIKSRSGANNPRNID